MLTYHHRAGEAKRQTVEATLADHPAGIMDTRRRTAAYWYAVGHADATGETDHAEAFSRYAESESVDYINGGRTWLASIPEQFETFTAELTR